MGLEAAGRAPARMSIASLATGVAIEAQFNPTELEEVLEVNWARLTVPGLSHQPLQFVHTGNVRFNLDLNFEVQDPTVDLAQIHHARRFLQSLCYPARGAATVATGGPSRVLFIWPGMVSLTSVITTLTFKYTRFNVEGTPVQFTAKLGLEEIRDVRLTADEVLADGSRRSGADRGAL
jgi:hypothetical protein